jgi:heptosyltransferase-2
MDPKPIRILIRTPQWLGDAVTSTVFVSRVRAREPRAHITILCPAGIAPVFENHPAVDRVLTLNYPAESVWALGRRLRAEKFDLTYTLPRSFKTALEAWLSGAPRRFGFASDWRSWLLTDRRRYDYGRRYPLRYLALLDEDTLDINATRPFFPAQAPDAERIRALLGRRLEDLARPLIGLAPASLAPARSWLPERFATVANDLRRDEGGTVVLFGSKAETVVCADVARTIGDGAIDTSGRLSLTELGWLLNEMDVFLANDSGLMHIAACFEVPTVIVFGSSDPNVILPPWGPFEAVKADGLFCSPCVRNLCVRFAEDRYECMKLVGVDAVRAAAARLRIRGGRVRGVAIR